MDLGSICRSHSWTWRYVESAKFVSGPHELTFLLSMKFESNLLLCRLSSKKNDYTSIRNSKKPEGLNWLLPLAYMKKRSFPRLRSLNIAEEIDQTEAAPKLWQCPGSITDVFEAAGIDLTVVFRED